MNACVGTYDLCIPKGNSWRQSIVWRAAGVPVDLTGIRAKMQVRYYPEAPLPLVELSTENDRIQINALAGEIKLALAPDTTQGLPVGSFVYDLRTISAGGFVLFILRGVCNVLPSVTH